jgi:hypothetical protein
VTVQPRPRLVIHAHFYQPSRLDPFTGQVPREPSAAPFHDWNERIAAECYRPNAERGNLEKISFDLGPTLANWLALADPATHARFVAADSAGDGALGAGAGDGALGTRSDGNALALAYHHAILPLASLRDRRTEIRWGIREFELRFGRRPAGMWLPEAAMDLPSLRLLAEHGITHTILAPWQSADAAVETRRPYRVSLGGGRSMVIVYFDRALSAAVSFDPDATIDAEAFAREFLGPRFAEPLGPGRPPSKAPGPSSRRSTRTEIPTVVIASDGEFYGHHQKFRDLFLQRLIGADGSPTPADYDVVNLATVVADEPEAGFPPTHVSERTSWSCHHGVLRWTGECPDAHDGRWKGPLRQALDRLAAGIDQVTEQLLPEGLGADTFWAARDGYVDVLQGAIEPAAFLERHLDGRAPAASRERVLDLFEAQRWRLAMFASDGWFWDDPSRLETQQILRAAARAVRIVDGHAGTSLERRLGDDLCLFTSPARGIDGYELYREALADVGQAMP